jgi:hypothetical protein
MKHLLIAIAALFLVACGAHDCLDDNEQARIVRVVDIAADNGANPSWAKVNLATSRGHRVCSITKTSADTLRPGEVVVGPLDDSSWRIRE